MTIREINTLTEECFAAVASLTAQLSQGRTVARETLESVVSQSNSHLFLLSDDEGIAGMLTIGIYDSPTGRKAWIEDVAVDSSRRGRGYGRALVDHAIVFARDEGVQSLSLTSHPSREAANRLYRRAGMEPYETNLYRIKL